MAEMDVDQLNIKIEADSGKASDGIDLLIESLEMLQNAIGDLSGLKKISKELEKIGTVSVNLKGLDEVADKISKLTIGLKPLETMGKNTINPFLNSLKKLPDIAKQLQNTDLDKFAVEIERVTKAIRPLANEMNKVANGFNAFPQKIQKLVRNLDSVTTSSSKTTRSFSGLLSGFSGMSLKAGLLFAVMSRMATTMGEWVQESNNYVENLNLFTVAMGEGAEEALKYAETVNNAMGIDMSQFIRNQGVFNQMITGFGLVGESANKMSKNLTTLGYDISSFHNISINDAMLKLESGIAGEPEPLRKLGYALDEVTLKELAFSQGIEKNIRDMSQAEKTQLRYIAIMKQSKNAMGDMARTLSSPANQMRILEQQILQLKRALGNVLIPIIMKVLPYVTALVRVLADGANALARLMGFELPKFDYDSSNITGGLGEIDNGLGDIKDSADKAKKAVQNLAGFDELNILSRPSDTDVDSTGGTGGGGGGIGGDLGVELPEYDFLAGLDKQTDEIYKKMKDTFKKIGDEIKKLLPIIKTVATALAAIWAIKKIMDFISWVKKAATTLESLKIIQTIGGWLGAAGINASTFFGLLAKISLTTFGSWLVFDVFRDNVREALTGTKTWQEAIIEMGIVLAGVGAALAIIVSPWALIPVGIAALAGILIGIAEAEKILMEQDLATRFGDVQLSMEECEAVAQKLTTSEFTLKLGVFIDGRERLDELYTEVSTISEDITKQSWLISMGVDVDLGEFQSTINTFIATSKETVEQQAFVSTMAIELGISDPDIKGGMTAFVQKYLEESTGKLEELGKAMRTTIDTALSDGVLDESELKTIQNIQSEVNQITQKLADAEQKAKLSALSLDFSGTDITAENFQTIMDKANQIAAEQMESLEGVRLENLKVAELKFATDKENKVSNAQEIYDNAKKDIQQTFVDNKMDLQLNVNKFGTDTLVSAFGAELALAKPALSDDVETIFAEGINAGITNLNTLYNQPISDLTDGMGQNYKNNLAQLDISEPVKKNLAKCLEVLKPSHEEISDIVSYNKSRGVAVPDGIISGINDVNTLLALSGSLDGLNAKVGEKLSTDKTFLDMLDTAKVGGQSIDGSVVAGITANLPVLKTGADQIPATLRSIIPDVTTAGGDIFKAFQTALSGEITLPMSFGTPTRPKQYATGGFPTRGDMFIANEQGPEMVGTIGGRTAVANNDQIVSAIEAGVYRAVNSAMGGKQQQSGDIVIPVYIGNDAVDEIIVSAQQRQLIRSNGRG